MSHVSQGAQDAACGDPESLQQLEARLCESLDIASRLRLDFVAIRIEEARLIVREQAFAADITGWSGLSSLH